MSKPVVRYLPGGKRRRARREQETAAVKAREKDLDRLYPHEYIGQPSAFGLENGPCVIERKWAGGYIVRDMNGRRWTVARRDVRKREAP